MLTKLFFILSILSFCNGLSFDFNDKRIVCYNNQKQQILCPGHVPQISCKKQDIWICKPHHSHPNYFYQTRIETNGIKEFDEEGRLIKIYNPKYKAHVYIYKIDF